MGRVAAGDVIGDAESDLVFKRRLPQHGDRLLVCHQDLLDGRDQSLPFVGWRDSSAGTRTIAQALKLAQLLANRTWLFNRRAASVTLPV
jgi:hypothetical protein